MAQFKKGFTLIELLIYVGMFAAAAFLLTGILTTVLRVQNRGVITNEVSAQANFVLETLSRHVRQSSLIEKVYEGNNENTQCVKYCSVKLRMSDPSLDPTIISSDENAIYIKQGAGSQSALTNSKILVSNLNFRKNEIQRAHTILDIDVSLKYNSTDPRFFAVRSIKSAIGRVSAVTFDDHLFPVGDALSDIGQSPGRRWRNARFSGEGIFESGVVAGSTSFPLITGATGIYVPNGKYAQFENNTAGPPPVTDCDQNEERGRISIDTTNNRLYVCNGATRGWDYVNLIN